VTWSRAAKLSRRAYRAKPKKYGAICADPPWPENGGGKCKRGADRHYPTMKIKEIIALGPQIQALALPDSHLWLWVTNNYLKAGIAVLEAWGYRLVSIRTWFKGKRVKGSIEMQRAGLGQYLRGDTEQLLFGVRGKPPYRKRPDGKRAQARTSLVAPRTKKHSEKPKQAYLDIEQISAGPYLEMFARKRRKNWDAHGNEVRNAVKLKAA